MQRSINTLGKANQRILKKAFGFQNINQAIEHFGGQPKQKKYSAAAQKYAYEVMQHGYNSGVEAYNETISQKKLTEHVVKVQQKKQLKAPKEKEITFQLELKMKITHPYTTKSGEKKMGTPIYLTRTEGPFTRKESEIPSMVDKYNIQDSVKIEQVVGHKVILQANLKQGLSKSKQMMKEAFVLKQDWLPFARGICEEAYEQTNNTCVYHQLAKFLLNPPAGKPIKFLLKKRITEDSLFEYFKNQFTEEDDQEGDEYFGFSKTSGVSTEMLAKLCTEMGRTMYAYDQDSKMFYYVKGTDACNYCPIAFYCMHGHFYLIDDKDVIKSVSESNKTAKKIVTASVDDSAKALVKHDIFITESFDLENALNLAPGIYIVQKSNLDEEIIDFIREYQMVPRTKNRENVIIQFSYNNEDNLNLIDSLPFAEGRKVKENVIIAVDANYGQNIAYDQLSHVCAENGIEYVNEGIGSVIHSILYKKDVRKTLSPSDRQLLIESFDNKCAKCFEECECFEIDHTIPLGNGGTNDIANLQPLCKDCHSSKTKEENELGYQVKNESASCFNDIVVDSIVKTGAFKSYQFVETVETFDEVGLEDRIFKVDICKCRRNIALNFPYQWPVFSVMDHPASFDGLIKCGMYYVVTESRIPFRGSGWYFEPLIKYGLDLGLINLGDIKLQFIPSTTLDCTHFQKPIAELLDAFASEPALQKLAINSYIGLMGRSSQTAAFTKFSLSEDDAANWLCKQEYDIFIKRRDLSEEQVLYEGIFKQPVLQETTSYPIYSMILQQEAIELHQLETMIANSCATILDRNTDAIRYYSSSGPVSISQFFWDSAKKVLKYQAELKPKALRFEQLRHLVRSDVLDLSKFEMPWNTEYDFEGSAEDKALEIVDRNESFNIDGAAGTGKTYLMNCIRKVLDSQGKKYLGFAPTNKAARLIDGKTIHSLYFKFKHSKKALFAAVQNIEYIFIDEISMVQECFYQLFIMIKRTFPAIKFLIAGDFRQLAPVCDTWSGDYKNSAALFSLCSGNRVQLTTCRRADSVLFDLCKNVDMVDVSAFPVIQKTYLNLAYKHSTRIRVNHECQIRFLESHSEYLFIPKSEPKKSGDKKLVKTQDVMLCVGTPVIAHTTNKKMDILNSERFTVKSWSEETIVVTDGDREVECKVSQFHQFFYLAFCITVHSSQGETFNSPYTIYDWNFFHFEDKAKYVALSRSTDMKNIQIHQVVSSQKTTKDSNAWDADWFENEMADPDFYKYNC